MRRRDLLRAAAVAGTVGLAGCSYRPGPGDPRWLYGHEGETVAVLTPPRGGGPVLVVPEGGFGAPSGRVVLLDAATGTPRGTHRFDTDATAVGRTFPTASRPLPVALVDGAVGLLRRRSGGASTPDGADAWGDGDAFRARRLTTFDGTPESVAHDGRLTYAAVDGDLWAIQPDRQVRWKRTDVIDPDRRDTLLPTQAGVLVLARASNVGEKLLAFDREGRVRWELTDTPLGTPVTVPVRVEGGYCVTCKGGLVALDREGGVRWPLELRRRGSRPAVAGDTVYVTGADVLDAVAIADGTRRWQYEPDGAFLTGPATATPNRVLVHHENGAVTAVDGGNAVWHATHHEDYAPRYGRPLRVAGGSIITPTIGGVAAYWRRGETDPFPYL